MCIILWVVFQKIVYKYIMIYRVINLYKEKTINKNNSIVYYANLTDLGFNPFAYMSQPSLAMKIELRAQHAFLEKKYEQL